MLAPCAPLSSVASAPVSCASSTVDALVSASPLGPWLAGGCGVPRLRGMRYGDERCPAPSVRIGLAREPLQGWARTAHLFSLGTDWSSFRGRRSVVLMREPFPFAWINPCLHGDYHATTQMTSHRAHTARIPCILEESIQAL